MPEHASSEENLGPHAIEMDEWIDCAPFERHLGISISEAVNGAATLTMPFHRELSQGFGLMHGGALVSLADTAVVMAIKSLLAPGSRFATTRIEVNYLKPVTRGTVTASARITHSEGRDLFGICEVIGEETGPVLTSNCIFRIARDVDMSCLDKVGRSTKKAPGNR